VDEVGKALAPQTVQDVRQDAPNTAKDLFQERGKPLPGRMQNLSRQVGSKAAAPQTVQDVRQGAANAASGLTRKVLGAEVLLLADQMQRIILTLIRRVPAHYQPHDAGHECAEQDDDDRDAQIQLY
jgi:hypothetical protein